MKRLLLASVITCFALPAMADDSIPPFVASVAMVSASQACGFITAQQTLNAINELSIMFYQNKLGEVSNEARQLAYTGMIAGDLNAASDKGCAHMQVNIVSGVLGLAKMGADVQ